LLQQATGCNAVAKPAEQTSTSVIMLMELMSAILPAGSKHRNWFWCRSWTSFSYFKTYPKLSFTGSTKTGRKVYHNAARKYYSNYGIRKVSNIFFPSVAAQDDKFSVNL
jgi:aldehyde dehydrogenase (NAD+)/aldehyde dehydrogenase